MIKLLIVADDFTGALDTAVQFASSGAKTRVITEGKYNFKLLDQATEVLVINAETRHLPPDQAYKIVFDIIQQAIEYDVPHIFKKTDSGLRGNIGSELAAVLDAAEDKLLHFIPALPKMNRFTEKGMHYIDGIEVSESVFGKDPFEPVAESYIPKLIELQTSIPAISVTKDEDFLDPENSCIVVYDAKTSEDIKEIAMSLHYKNDLKLIAGCAGLASILPSLLGLTGEKPESLKEAEKFLVVCGSVNPITQSQLDYAERNGFNRIRLAVSEKIDETFYETEIGQKTLNQIHDLIASQKNIIIDSNDLNNSGETIQYALDHGIPLDTVRERISHSLGRILKSLIEKGLEATIMVTGGDTLIGFMKQIEASELSPQFEIAPGTVLSKLEINEQVYDVISKSGGFGSPNLLVEISNLLNTN